MHPGGLAVVDLHSIQSDVASSLAGVFGKHGRQCNERAAVPRPTGENRQDIEIGLASALPGGRVIRSISHFQFPETDFAAIARGFGARGATVRTLADLDAVRTWVGEGAPGVFLIDAKINPKSRGGLACRALS